MLNADRVRHFAPKPSAVKDGLLLKVPQRERGMWSFLTWSFFLSQLAVGNAFAGGSAHAATPFDPGAPSGADDTSASSANAPGTPDLSASSGEEGQSTHVPVAAAPQPSGPSAGAHEYGVAEHAQMTGDASPAPYTLASHDGGAIVATAAEPDMPPGELPGIDVPPIADVPPILDALPPILDTIDDLVEGLGPILDDILVPVVETIEDLGNVLDPVIDHVLVPVENVVDNVVELTEPIDNVADQILELADPILDQVDAALPPVVDLVAAIEPAAPILDVVAPVLDVVDKSILAVLPLNVGGGMEADEADHALDVVGLPGQLDFAEDGEPIVHELIEAGAYTEYGLAMQQAPATLEAAVDDQLVDIVAPLDAVLGDGAEAGQGPHALLGHLQHDAALRGLGDGLI